MSENVALLNPRQEAPACRKMITLVEEDIARLDTDLTTCVLDENAYLQKIGARKQLESLRKKMQLEYERNFAI